MPGTDLHKYFIAELYNEKIYAASVRIDNEKILTALGYKSLKFRHYRNNSLFTKLLRLINSFYFFVRCPKRSMVVFHFPFHAKMYIFLHKILKWKGIKTIAIIIDIDGIRDEDEKLLQTEIKQLKQFDFLVVHNNSMKDFLAKSISSKKMFDIEIFDYPSTLEPSIRRFEKSICIAANFNKGKYVYQLNKIENIQFNLYGQGFDNSLTAKPNNISFRGTFDPAELIKNLQGSFGLVWDGTGIDTCDGNTGKYLRYNNPYKLSLYIAAGLPVITWKESAIALFVEKNNIGITVSSLFELEEQLQNLSEEAYLQMRQNIIAISKKVASGYFLKTVMQKINGGILN